MKLFTLLKTRIRAISPKTYKYLAIVFFLGMVFAFALRFTFVDKTETHYHANFALYVNGQKDEFKSPTFYEEIAACSALHNTPAGRVHMHDNVSNIIHVHDEAVTWGQFFENIGYGISRETLLTDKGLFVDGVDGKTLTFILNGEKITNATNRVIQSEDVLLVEYGDSSVSTIKDHYEMITKDAGEFNKKKDPSACQGGQDEPFKKRFLRTLGIDTDKDKDENHTH